MNKQITEDYCTKEVSALLKKKGFDVCVKNYFSLNNDSILHNLDKKYGAKKNWNAFENCISRPSQSLALKWLREVHSIYITSEPDINDKHCFYPVIYTMTEESWDMQCFEELEKLSFYKPEQAVETALNYVLKNLI